MSEEIEVTEEEIRETARDVVAAVDAHRAGDVLRAAELGRRWLEATEMHPAVKLTPFRCFVMGYLAAMKDRT